MYVYKQTEPGLWTVGFYDPSGKWHPESDHDSPAEGLKKDQLNAILDESIKGIVATECATI